MRRTLGDRNKNSQRRMTKQQHVTRSQIDQPKNIIVFSGNPHMTNEWFGRFHDDDWESWNAYPEALKATGHKALKCWKVAGMNIF